MTIYGFVMVQAVGAALLALWLVTRFPDQGPTSLRGALLQLGASMLVGWVLTPLTTFTVGSGLPAAAFLAAFLIVLPGLVYIFVAWAWMVKVLQGALGRSHH